jgi:hypothetical protein
MGARLRVFLRSEQNKTLLNLRTAAILILKTKEYKILLFT